MMAGWFRYLCLAFAVIFLVFAALQLNDPDPIRWLAVYGAAALASAAIVSRPKTWPFAVLVAAVAAIWCGQLLGQVVGVVGVGEFMDKMSAKGGAVEKAREAGGLAIVSLWLATAATIAKKRSKPSAS
jgi:Transmembrane family 220, helix